MQVLLVIFVLYSALMLFIFWVLDGSEPSNPKEMATLELLERLQSIGSLELLLRPSPWFGWWRPYQRCWHIRLQRQFHSMQAELSSRDIHANGKASLGHGDSIFQLLEIMSMNANCDKAKLEECVDQYLALGNGQKYDLQPHGGIVTGSRRANPNKAKQTRTQRRKK